MLIILFIAFVNAFTPDQPKWQELSAFEIYSKVAVSNFHLMSEADIKKLPYKSADPNEAQRLLSMAKESGPIMWKGMAYLAIAKFKDGSSRRILINTYGSSFRDVTGKKNYTLSANAKEWQAFFTKNKPGK